MLRSSGCQGTGGDSFTVDLRAGFLSSPLFAELLELAGRDEYPESEAKRHHLVPRFLLQRFATDRGGRERIMQLDVTSGATRWVDPRTAASRMRFYRLDDEDGTQHQRLEYYLSVVENHAAEALERLRLDAALSLSDRATLSMFLALLEGRTKEGLARIERLADTTLKTTLAAHVADEAAFRDSYKEAIGSEDPDVIEDHRRSLMRSLEKGGIRLGNPKEVALDLMLEHAGETAQFIYQMEWYLLRCEDGGFVTSDRALAMCDPSPPYPWTGHGLLSSDNAQTTIPVDPTRCLLLRPPAAGGASQAIDVVQMNDSDVMEVNLRTYGFASEYVFAATQEAAAGLRRAAKNRPRDVVRPRPAHQVMLIDCEPGDDRLAQEHEARGWPPRLNVGGEWHDYVVLDPSDRAVERAADLAQLGKARAIRRLGSDEVRAHDELLDPRDFLP